MSSHQVMLFSSARYSKHYFSSMLQQWFNKREQIRKHSAATRRMKGGGQKPALGVIEDETFGAVMQMRIENQNDVNQD